MEKKVLNMKSEWIRSIFDVKKIFKTEDRTITFFTSFGYVTGELAEFKDYNLDSEEAVQEMLESKSTFEYADMAYSLIQKSDYKDLSLEDLNKTIPLKNVEIKPFSGNKILINTFILFTDQVTGLIPGKLK